MSSRELREVKKLAIFGSSPFFSSLFPSYSPENKINLDIFFLVENDRKTSE
jgi:hypothetical protein